MTMLRMCELGQVSRAGLYRFHPEQERPDRDLDLRDELQRIALEFPSYGRPRITAELKRRGWEVNHKRVGRIMHEDNLLCLRRRKFVGTTDSNHGFRVYPNLAGSMELTGLDQLWIADITYIRLETEFVYLAVVLDAFSRRVIGWALDRSIEDDLAITALQMAFRRRAPAAGLTHHSDRGVQYASNDYTGILKDHGVRISMSRSGNPYDNATCESFMKTLKYEEVLTTSAAATVSLVQDKVSHAGSLVAKEYRDLAEARASIDCFIEKIYNGKRLHSALGYRPPVEFERSLPIPSAAPGQGQVAV